jgi:hypothetical protein
VVTAFQGDGSAHGIIEYVSRVCTRGSEFDRELPLILQADGSL